MVSAIWSMPFSKAKDMPLKLFLNFFINHGLFRLKNRPQWFTVSNRSKTYVNNIIDLDFPEGTIIASGTQVCLDIPQTAVSCVPLLCDVGPEKIVDFTLIERINLTVVEGTYSIEMGYPRCPAACAKCQWKTIKAARART